MEHHRRGRTRERLARLCALGACCLTTLSAHPAADAPRLTVQSGPRALFLPQLVISPDKSLVASTGEMGSGSVYIWQIATGRLVCTLPAQLAGGGAGMMSPGVAGMAFSKDGAALATPSSQGALQLWDLRRCDKRDVVQVGEGRTSREPARGMLLTRAGELLVLGGDGSIYAGDAFAGKALRSAGKSSGAGGLLHGASADGRFVVVSGAADGAFSGWNTRVIDTQTGAVGDLSNMAGPSGAAAMPSPMARFLPPAAAISPSGRWILKFEAGEVRAIDRSRGVVTGSVSMLQAPPAVGSPSPAVTPDVPPDAQRPTKPGLIRDCPPAATAGPQAKERCDRLAEAMRTLGGGRVAAMENAVRQMKQQAQQHGPAALVPPWFGFSEREDAVYIWRNPSPTVAGQPLSPDQRSVIDVRKLPDLGLVRQSAVHDADALAPFFGATANGFAASQDGRLLAVVLQSIDMGAGRLGVVDLAALGERAAVRSWKPSGGYPAGLQWAADGRLLAAISGQRQGATLSLAGRSVGPGPDGGPARPPGSIAGMPGATASKARGMSAPVPTSIASTLVQWPMAGVSGAEVTTRSVATTSPRPAKLSPGGAFAAVMKLNADAAKPERSRPTIEIVATNGMQHVREVELVDDRGAAVWAGKAGGFEQFAISADGHRIAAMTRRARSESAQAGGEKAREFRQVSLHDAHTGRQLAAVELPVATGIEFLGADGSSMLVGTGKGTQCVAVIDGRLVAAPFGSKRGPLAVFGGDPVHAVAADAGGGISRCGTAKVKWIQLASKDVKDIQLDASGSRLAVARDDTTIELYQVEADGSTVHTGVLPKQQQDVMSMAFSPDARLLASTQTTGATSIWNLASSSLLAQLFAFEDGAWAVVDAQGRFDTNNVEDLEHLHWVMPDDSLRALPLEIFMRDYFSPGLLARLVRGQPLPPVRAVGELNRAQPVLRIASVSPSRDDPRRVDVTVEAEGAIDARGRASGVVDVRLFRDGRLVGYPQREGEPLRLDPTNNRAKVTFRGIRLPQAAQTVAFSTYAFNTDRVKSATARSVYRPASVNATHKGKAYVIAIGVNNHDNAAFDLRYAANDARLALDVLSKRIAAEGAYGDVIPIALVSDGERLRDASKARIRAAIDVLAGKAADRQALAGVANASRLAPATPDDLVIVTFAGHGHAGEAGVFYLLPQDIGGASMQMTPPMLSQSISTDELAAWLRDVDAGEMAMVIDACYSASSVESEDFKPGPMGSRGLGQLAYDKGMRVLAASQARDVAIEADRLEHGLLTFALMRDGIEARRADFRPVDQRIRLGEWLAYGAEGVPRLHRELVGGSRAADRGTRAAVRLGATPRVQQPRLFDFSRRGDGPVIASSK